MNICSLPSPRPVLERGLDTRPTPSAAATRLKGYDLHTSEKGWGSLFQPHNDSMKVHNVEEPRLLSGALNQNADVALGSGSREDKRLLELPTSAQAKGPKRPIGVRRSAGVHLALSNLRERLPWDRDAHFDRQQLGLQLLGKPGRVVPYDSSAAIGGKTEWNRGLGHQLGARHQRFESTSEARLGFVPQESPSPTQNPCAHQNHRERTTHGCGPSVSSVLFADGGMSSPSPRSAGSSGGTSCLSGFTEQPGIPALSQHSVYPENVIPLQRTRSMIRGSQILPGPNRSFNGGGGGPKMALLLPSVSLASTTTTTAGLSDDIRWCAVEGGGAPGWNAALASEEAQHASYPPTREMNCDRSLPSVQQVPLKRGSPLEVVSASQSGSTAPWMLGRAEELQENGGMHGRTLPSNRAVLQFKKGVLETASVPPLSPLSSASTYCSSSSSTTTSTELHVCSRPTRIQTALRGTSVQSLRLGSESSAVLFASPTVPTAQWRSFSHTTRRGSGDLSSTQVLGRPAGGQGAEAGSVALSGISKTSGALENARELLAQSRAWEQRASRTTPQRMLGALKIRERGRDGFEPGMRGDQEGHSSLSTLRGMRNPHPSPELCRTLAKPRASEHHISDVFQTPPKQLKQCRMRVADSMCTSGTRATFASATQGTGTEHEDNRILRSADGNRALRHARHRHRSSAGRDVCDCGCLDEQNESDMDTLTEANPKSAPPPYGRRYPLRTRCRCFDATDEETAPSEPCGLGSVSLNRDLATLRLTDNPTANVENDISPRMCETPRKKCRVGYIHSSSACAPCRKADVSRATLTTAEGCSCVEGRFASDGWRCHTKKPRNMGTLGPCNGSEVMRGWNKTRETHKSSLSSVSCQQGLENTRKSSSSVNYLVPTKGSVNALVETPQHHRMAVARKATITPSGLRPHSGYASVQSDTAPIAPSECEATAKGARRHFSSPTPRALAKSFINFVALMSSKTEPSMTLESQRPCTSSTSAPAGVLSPRRRISEQKPQTTESPPISTTKARLEPSAICPEVRHHMEVVVHPPRVEVEADSLHGSSKGCTRMFNMFKVFTDQYQQWPQLILWAILGLLLVGSVLALVVFFVTYCTSSSSPNIIIDGADFSLSNHPDVLQFHSPYRRVL